MKNKYFIRVIKLIALIIPLAVLIVFGQTHLFYYDDHNTHRIENFYEQEEDSLDVVFIGASELINGYFPGKAYEKYGFTSYLYAMDANPGSLYVSQLKEIMKHQSPQVILVEIYGFLNDEDAPIYDEARLRVFVENIPFSVNKAQTILEQPFENKISFFVPFIKYHGDLETAQERISEGFEKPEDVMALFTKTATWTGSGDQGVPFDPAIYELSEDSRKCLIAFLEYCRNEKMDNIVFLNYPWYIQDENNHNLLTLVAQVKEIVSDYGYPFVDLQEKMDQIGLDVAADYYDEQHTNVYGQVKITDYLGSILVDEYHVVPREQSPENEKLWGEYVTQTQEWYDVADYLIQIEKDTYIFESSYWWVCRDEY